MIIVNCTVDGCAKTREMKPSKFKINKTGRFYCKDHYRSSKVAVSCAYCGISFLVFPYKEKHNKNFFCPKTNHFALWKKGKNNPFYDHRHTKEAKKKMSVAHTGKNHGCVGEKHHFYGKTHSDEVKKKMSIAALGKTGFKHSEETKKKISATKLKRFKQQPMSEETKRKMSESAKRKPPVSEEARKKMSIAKSGEKHYGYGKTGNKCHNYGRKHSEEAKKKMSDAKRLIHPCAGGSSYDHYAPLLFDEKTRRDCNNPAQIQVRCKFNNCRKWFMPSQQQCSNRLYGIDTGINYFYCSSECKDNCSIYKQREYPKGTKPKNERQKIVDPAFRKMVLEKDNYKCIRCEAIENLKAHHIEGVIINPMVANDIDNGITFCSDCHDWIHSQEGCYYSDYQRADDCHSKALSI